MVTTMGVMLILYIVLLILWALDLTGNLAGLFGAIRPSLLAATVAIGATYFYLRTPQKTTAKAASTGATTVDKSGYIALKKDTEAWMLQLADALKSQTAFADLDLPAEVSSLKNHSKLNSASKAILAELEALRSDKTKTQELLAQKDKHIKKLEESIVAKDAEIAKAKTDIEAAQLQVAAHKQSVVEAQQSLGTQVAEAEKLRKEAVSKVERYRNISKFLEQAKSTLYSQHGVGKEYLVQLKLGLLADDAINLSNKNDYHSLNYDLFRNGRPFAQLVKEQPPTHIDAYPDSVKKLRQWIKTSGLEGENWDLFYQNYPVTDKL